MQTRYRVYTENVNYDGTIELAKQALPDSFTVHKAEGFWQGVGEHSLVFEVIGTEETEDQIRKFAFDVKRVNKQQAVLITTEPVNSVLV